MRQMQKGRRSARAGSWILIALFAAMLTVPTLAWLTVGDASQSELDEKRALDEFPTGLGNRYVAQVASWYGDHAPYRSAVIAWKVRAAQAIGARYRETVHPALSALCAPDWYSAADAGGEAYLAPVEESSVIYGRDDWLFYTENDSLDFYQGRNVLSEEEMAAWLAAYERLDEICRRRGVRLVVMTAPNKEQVYPEFMPSYYVAPGPKREEAFCAYVRQNSGLTYLYPLEELLAAKARLPVYFRQDTHWNAIGAYVGAQELYRAVGMPLSPLERADVTEVTKRGGDLSNLSGLFSDYPDYTLEYRPEVDVRVTSTQREFYSVDRYESTADSERKIIVLGDSFSPAIMSYLAKDFRSATLAPRGVTDELLTKAWEELSEGDVLLLMAVERNDEQNVGAAELLAEQFE